MNNIMNLEYQRCLSFKYYDIDKAKELEKLLSNNNINYVAYYDGLYILFKVAKSGKKWNDLMRLINSIKAPVYKYVQACIVNGEEYELLPPITASEIWKLTGERY